MRKAFRSLLMLLGAYLIQCTILPYFKVNGVMLDLISITLYTIGFSMGYYAGVMAGFFEALVLEVVGGDLPGLTSVICVVAGALGAYVAVRVGKIHKVGNRGLERTIKQFAPMVGVAIFGAAKELVYLAYFYLTGVTIGFSHFFRVIIAGVEVLLLSVVLIPVGYGLLMRKPKEKAAKEMKDPNKEIEKRAVENWPAIGVLPVEGRTEE